MGSFCVCASSGFFDAAESKPTWQAEWERTVKAAEEEGQLTVYIAGYGALIDSGVFQKAYPKIKVTSVTGSGTQLAPRIVAERRGEKYLVDVYSGGGTFALSEPISRQDARSDQAGADLAGSYRSDQVVGGQAKIR